MNTMLRTLCLAITALALCGWALSGCADDDHGHVHAHGDNDHDHAHDGEGHAHDDGDHDHDHDHDHDNDDDHAQAHGAGAVDHVVKADAFGGRALTVEVAGTLKSGAEYHVAGRQTAGPATDTLRFWIGDDSGKGSVKARANLHDGHFHVHVMVPAEIPAGAALWIEAMTADGERQRTSLPL